MEISLKNPSGNVGTRTCVAGICIPFLGMYDGQEDIASLLTTDTGDAGTSPHVARFFQLYFHDKYCYLYIIEWTTVPL